MERQFFSWTAWDEFDFCVASYQNCILKQDIGPHKIGDKIDQIVMNYVEGEMTFYDMSNGEVTDKFTLSLNVVA